MIKVAPSILSADFVNLERDIRHIQDCGADYVHIDVMDGLFVPNITIGIPVVAAIRKITDLPLDVHLMIDRPIRYVEEFCDAGADIVTIHAEADTPENNLEALRRIRAKGVRAAVSIKPNTPAQVVDDYFDAIDMVLVMTVEPGFGGQKFMADMMPKVRALRKIIDVRFPGVELEVDGGVNLETAQTCIESGANVLVAGSALFKAADTGEFIHTIQKMY
jgi:ribulose-phosphate 3-epimerase